MSIVKNLALIEWWIFLFTSFVHSAKFCGILLFLHSMPTDKKIWLVIIVDFVVHMVCRMVFHDLMMVAFDRFIFY
jgi:hypothetical protein